MKNGRNSDAQIMAVLKQAEGGVPPDDLEQITTTPTKDKQMAGIRIFG